jgi:hypothetical protein
MIEDLRWLRRRVVERLAAIEALARQRVAPSAEDGEIAARERILEQKAAELEEGRAQLHTEAKRQAKQWSEAMAQLDTDRRLLAEAWERLEQQRIEGLGTPDGTPTSHGHGHAPAGGTPTAFVHGAPPGPKTPARTDPEPVNPVAQTILRQFEPLCRDVRSNANSRRGSS